MREREMVERKLELLMEAKFQLVKFLPEGSKDEDMEMLDE
jgi:hypothetical protein